MNSYSKKSVIDFIEHYGNVLRNGIRENEYYWVLESNIIVFLPNNNERVSYAQLEVIALEQLEVSHLEFDYWLGEQDK